MSNQSEEEAKEPEESGVLTLPSASAPHEQDGSSPSLPPIKLRVLSTHSPKGLGHFHPTQAVLQDLTTGELYVWNSRAHRKLRYLQNQEDTRKKHHFPRLWCFEPYIVTWWMNITNIIANIFWTTSGVYATWPFLAKNNADKLVYAFGILAGVFMILSCYLSYVEAVHQSTASIHLSSQHSHGRRRRFHRSGRIYGRFLSPIGCNNYPSGAHSKRHFTWMKRFGYPVIENAETGEVLDLNNSDPFESAADVEKVGHELQSKIGLRYKVTSPHYVFTTELLNVSIKEQKKESYEWWTWHPPLDQLAVVLGFIGFISAIVYLIPMLAEYPLAQNADTSVGVTVFFVDVLQVIPYICFAACGHVYVAEAAGGWWKPKLDSIGYQACVFNLIGAYGFLMCGALAIPVTIGSDCCPNMAKWGSSFACFWGSVAYLVGGILQWIEFANPEPIVFKNKSGEKQK